MEDELFNNYMPTLKEFSLMSVAACLCNTEESLEVFRDFRFKFEDDDNKKIKEWNSTLNVVVKQALKLDIPVELMNELIPILRPIGSEVVKWRNFMENFFYKQDLVNHIDAIAWTGRGTIDYCKTAINIVKQKPLDKIACYQMACLFCLEDEIQAIWEKLTDQEKVLCNESETRNADDHKGVLSFWAYTINGDLNAPFDCLVLANMQGCTVYQYAFETACTSGNFVAVQYFFPKLTYEEREISLMKTAMEAAQSVSVVMPTTEVSGNPTEARNDILSYLFENMTKEERGILLKEHPYIVMQCYIDWPRQRLFPRLMEHMWNFFREMDYDFLIGDLAHQVNLSAYNYPKLFRECFLKSPMPFLQYMLELQSNQYSFLSQLFDANDAENIKLVITSMASCSKERIFICDSAFDICLKLVCANKWYLLKIFIRECATSEEIKSRFKVGFKRYASRIYTKKQIKLKRNKLLKFYRMLSQINVDV